MSFIQKYIVVVAWLFFISNSFLFFSWAVGLGVSAGYFPRSPFAPFYLAGVFFSGAVILVSFVLAIRITRLRKTGNRISLRKQLIYFNLGVIIIPIVHYIALYFQMM